MEGVLFSLEHLLQPGDELGERGAQLLDFALLGVFAACGSSCVLVLVLVLALGVAVDYLLGAFLFEVFELLCEVLVGHVEVVAPQVPPPGQVVAGRFELEQQLADFQH